MMLNFSVIAIIAKINTKIKINVVNRIPNNSLKFICVICTMNDNATIAYDYEFLEASIVFSK
jgi:hypothetical protein